MASAHVRISQAALMVLAALEGYRSRAYRDRGGRPTIGYGSTRGVQMGDVVTPQGAADMLLEDVAVAEGELEESLAGRQVTRGQWDALTLLFFNCGGPALDGSRLMRKLRAGDVAGAAGEFKVWNKVRVLNRKTGRKELKVDPILVRRRAIERAMFEGGP